MSIKYKNRHIIPDLLKPWPLDARKVSSHNLGNVVFNFISKVFEYVY
jgi:hypothetical protein